MTDKGLIQYLSGFATGERLNRFKEVLENRTRYITVVLEELYQQHNASAVLRTCDCFGIQDVHVIEGINKFTVNDSIAMGASKWLSICRYKMNEFGIGHTISELKSVSTALLQQFPILKLYRWMNLIFKKGKLPCYLARNLMA